MSRRIRELARRIRAGIERDFAERGWVKVYPARYAVNETAETLGLAMDHLRRDHVVHAWCIVSTVHGQRVWRGDPDDLLAQARTTHWWSHASNDPDDPVDRETVRMDYELTEDWRRKLRSEAPIPKGPLGRVRTAG